MSGVIPFGRQAGRPQNIPEFLKRDTAGAKRRLRELMGRPEWSAFCLRAEFERALHEALGIDFDAPPPPDAA